MASLLVQARRLVIKVGSSLVTNQGHGLDHAALAEWAEQIAELKRRNREVLLVSSGAMAAGMQRLGWARRPRQLHEQQAAAALGQMGLVQAYEYLLPHPWPARSADPAHARGPGRPQALPQRALDAAHAAPAGHRPDDQRERHGGHGGDQVRRQRHAGGSGDQSGGSRCARHPDRSTGLFARPRGDPDAPARAPRLAGDPALGWPAGREPSAPAAC